VGQAGISVNMFCLSISLRVGVGIVTAQYWNIATWTVTNATTHMAMPSHQPKRAFSEPYNCMQGAASHALAGPLMDVHGR
jgi:hypothetical protein